MKQFPVIDPAATGENIRRLRLQRGLSVRDLQDFFGFEEPQAIYKWQWGKSLPSVDNLYALSTLLGVPMDAILVPVEAKLNIVKCEQQAVACCSAVFLCIRRGRYDNAPARSLAILSQPRRLRGKSQIAFRKGETESNAPEGASIMFWAGNVSQKVGWFVFTAGKYGNGAERLAMRLATGIK